MARGTCFCITEYAEDADIECSELEASEYVYGETDYFCEYVDEEGIKFLLDLIKKNDGIVSEENGVTYFILTEHFKRNFFKTRLEKFREAAEKISLDEFSLADPYKLRSLIEDPYADAVYWKGQGFYTLDRFIRIADTGTKYYMKNAYVMH